MQASQRPARNGVAWLIGGYRLVRRRPAALIAVAAAYWFIVLFLGALPYVGSLLVSTLVPGLLVGVLNTVRQAGKGEVPRLDAIVSAFRGDPERTRALLILGAVYWLVWEGVLGVSALIDGGSLQSLMSGRPVEFEALQSPEFQAAAQLTAVFMMPVLMAWWYAPMLAAWHGVSVLKSLVFSFIACWRNWRAFMVYGLASAVVGLPLVIFTTMLMILTPLGPGGGRQLLLLVALLVLAPIFFASFYLTYRDVFEADDNETPPTAAPGSTLDTEA